MPPKTQKVDKRDSSGDVIDDSSCADGRLMDTLDHMMNKIIKSLTDSFNLCMTQVAAAIEAKLSVKIDVQGRELYEMNNKLESLERRCNELQADNMSLRAEIKKHDTRITEITASCDDLEQYSRSENILLHGLPLPQDGSTEDLYKLVPETINRHMPGITLAPDMISVVHRLAPNRQSTAGSSTTSNKPPPVVMRLVRRSIRNSLLANKKLLKNKSISLTEHLTPRRSQLLRKANALVVDHKINSAWSQEGRVLVKTNGNRIVVIANDTDLAALC